MGIHKSIIVTLPILWGLIFGMGCDCACNLSESKPDIGTSELIYFVEKSLEIRYLDDFLFPELPGRDTLYIIGVGVPKGMPFKPPDGIKLTVLASETAHLNSLEFDIIEASEHFVNIHFQYKRLNVHGYVTFMRFRSGWGLVSSSVVQT